MSSLLAPDPGYDTVGHDRVPLDQEEGHRDEVQGAEGAMQGSVIGPTGGRRNKWGRLASIDRAGGPPDRS